MTKQPHNPLETPEKPELTIDLHDSSQEQVSIIVVHHNRPDYLNLCIQSITCMSHLNNYEIIVVDNNSDQETQEYLDVLAQEGVKIVRNTSNVLWSKAANQGVAVADPNSRYFVFMHADTVVLDHSWLDLLINISISRGAGIVGTALQSYYIQRNQKMDFVQEWCMLMSRECWDDIGPWPEELPLVAMSFIMTLRAQFKGHKPQTTGNAIVHHYRAFIMKPNEYEKICEQAQAALPKLMQKAQAG